MIDTPNHLAYILKVELKEILSICQDPDTYYYSSKEQKFKKNGEPRLNWNGEPIFRILYPSKGRLKQIQYRILKEILEKLPLPTFMYGGVKGKNNIQNARFHQGNKYFFQTDLKKFYPSVSNDMVFKMFRSHGFSPDVTILLTELVTFKGQLPQGTHSSPRIANLVLAPILNGIKAKLPKSFKVTSLVDDLTISSKEDFKHIVPTILAALTKEGLSISHRKTNYKTRFPEVTGVVVKNNNLDVPQRIKNKLNDPTKTAEQIEGVKRYIKRVHSS